LQTTTAGTDADLTRPADNDSSCSSDEDRPEGCSGGGGGVNGGGLSAVPSAASSTAATQRARHQPAEVLQFAAGLADPSQLARTRTHWDALVAVAGTYCHELDQSSE